MTVFEWNPGVGTDADALARLINAFPRPTSPMGEAWFMGDEREMFVDAVQRDVPDLSSEYVERMLQQVATGITCFGPMDEWTEWFHYLIPRVVQKPFKRDPLDYPLELLVTALFAQYPRGLAPAPYKGFGQDVLATVGQSVMSPELWDGGGIRVGTGLITRSHRYGEEWWYLDEANPALSASLFVVAKYLAPNQMGSWVRSLARIDSSYWRAQIIVWLVGARPVLNGDVEQPSQFDKVSPRIQWSWSHTLGGFYDGLHPGKPLVDAKGAALVPSGQRNAVPFIGDANLAALRKALNEALPGPVRREWIASALSEPRVALEAGSPIQSFEDFRL